MQKKQLDHERKKAIDIVVSKNRQDWINTVRLDIANLISKTSYITHDLRATMETKYKESNSNPDGISFSDFIMKYREADEIVLRVELFLNRDKEEHRKLISDMYSLKTDLLAFCNLNLKANEMFYKDPNMPKLKANINHHLPSIKETTQTAIAIEWDKIKSGKNSSTKT